MDKRFIEKKIREIKIILDEIESEISTVSGSDELTVMGKIDAILEVKAISGSTKKFIESIRAFIKSGKKPSSKQVDCVNKTYDTLFE